MNINIVWAECDCRASEPVSSARCLFQAVRSYLHFSQLSAWLNATHGTAPQFIGYRSVSFSDVFSCVLKDASAFCNPHAIVAYIAIVIMSVFARLFHRHCL